MTLLPRPIPHPLEYCPFDVPGWAASALESVAGSGWPSEPSGPSGHVGAPSEPLGAPSGPFGAPAGPFGWPVGDEVATWDLADRWFSLADALAAAREDAFDASARIVAGCGAAGIPADGFGDAWERLAGSRDAPLNALTSIAAELGTVVEECARDIEAAKLEAWIEIGLFLTELAGLSVVVELTSGAASPAVEGLIGATRVNLQRIFARLVGRMSGLASPADSRTRTPSAPLHDETATRRLFPPSHEHRVGGGEGVTRRLSRSEVERAIGAPSSVTISPPVPPVVPAQRTGPVGVAGAPAASAPPAPGASAGRPAHLADAPDEYAGFLAAVAAETRAKIRELSALAGREAGTGSRANGEQLRQRVADLRALLAEVDAEAARPDHPARLGPATSLGAGAGAAAEVVGAPLGVHQKALEDAMPRAGDGGAPRLADPRAGGWFRLVNDGGPATDPARGLNCLDVVLALFDTYLHGRPRVAAPRTADTYAHGEVHRPAGGEWRGPARIEEATGATFQNLCPFLGAADPAAARPAVDAAMRNLTNHLHNSGHGSFAVILTELEGGGCHAWSAVNQNGTILFLDPQIALVSEEIPLYAHGGTASPDNVVSMDALVVDGQANPAPLPYHGPGQWSGAPATDGPT